MRIGYIAWPLRIVGPVRLVALSVLFAFQALALSVQKDAAPVGPPVIKLLSGDLDAKQRRAQAIAAVHPSLARASRDPVSGAALRTEVFAVYPARVSDVPKGASCPEAQCYRVDIYSFAYNMTFSLIVDLVDEQVLSALRQQGAQAELPNYLAERAIEIARADPEVVASLGSRPGPSDALMANTKTALNASSCERSRHLCVAPTFIMDDVAVWVIVDLTEERVVGVRWTEVGKLAGGAITEESLKTEEVFDRYCKAPTHLEKDGWVLDYILTSSDGLQVSDVSFRNQPVLRSAKNVDWHVSYSSREGFGYSDAVGCPMFSSASVQAYGGPDLLPLGDQGQRTGFVLVQDFRQMGWPLPCHYRYEQRYEFYRDGRFRIVAGNLGRGCGIDGVYRPVLRIDLAPNGQGMQVARWNGNAWQPWDTEGWLAQDDGMTDTAQGYALRVDTGSGRGYYVVPGKGQFSDGGRGDHAYMYVTRYHSDEGDADMVTIGPCCNADHEQGPEKFIGAIPESTAGQDLVLWYVARQQNDHRTGHEYCWADNVLRDGVYVPKAWPCYVGPMFVPFRASL